MLVYGGAHHPDLWTPGLMQGCAVCRAAVQPWSTSFQAAACRTQRAVGKQNTSCPALCSKTALAAKFPFFYSLGLLI